MFVCACKGQGGIRCRGLGGECGCVGNTCIEEAPIEYSLGVACAYLGLKPT